MAQPRHRMAANATIALRDVRPVAVFLETDKDTQRALISALGQHHLVAFAECSTNSRSIAHHVRTLLRPRGLPRPRGSWPELRLVHEPGLLHLGSLYRLLVR